jgi:hypothetical protein
LEDDDEEEFGESKHVSVVVFGNTMAIGFIVSSSCSGCTG